MVGVSAIVSAKPSPPSGTHEIALEELKYKPDLRVATLGSEFCANVYRTLTSAATSDSYEKEVARLGQISKIYGYHVQVVSSAHQQAAIFYNDTNIFVVFEGSRLDQVSHYNRNLLTYLRFKYADAPSSIGGRIHYGFNSALDETLVHKSDSTIWSEVDACIHRLHAAKPDRRLYFAGHSAGGAIATIAAARSLDAHPDLHIHGLYTFGQPRVGDRDFKNGLEAALNKQRTPEEDSMGSRYFRFEQYGDPMPALPPKGRKNIPGEYVHGGQWIPMDMAGHILAMNDSKPKAVGVEPNTVEDTFSRSNPADHISITTSYNYVLGKVIGAVRAARSMVGYGAMANPETADIKVIEDSSLVDTFSGLLNLFNVKNYLHHEMPSYRKGLLLYCEAHPQTAHLTELKEADAQHLLWRTINLSEHFQAAIPQMPEGIDKKAALDCQRVVEGILSDWEPLQETAPARLLKPQRTHVGPYLNFWVEQPTTLSDLRMRYIHAVQGSELLNQVTKLRDALDTFSRTAHTDQMTHEELKTLMPDVRACLNVAEDVVAFANRQQQNTR